MMLRAIRRRPGLATLAAAGRSVDRQRGVLFYHASCALSKELDSQDNSTRIVSSNFPDFIEHWNRKAFYNLGYASTALSLGMTGIYGVCQETVILNSIVLGYWALGLKDMNQRTHALLRNFPVLGNLRFIFEMLRPEIRQYFVESDEDGKPFDRNQRSIVYQRAKNVSDVQAFGTRRDVYAEGYEFCSHSMYPTELNTAEKAALSRVVIGGRDCKQPYSSALLNVSGMSYGALSDNAILALSTGAQMGGFYHNTGEGGVSRFHMEGGGDLVWNIGTGYFGCRNGDGTFSDEMFLKTLKTAPQIKMLEIKLSQGAKPAHGGLLPGAKVTKFIAEARGVSPGVDCHSPPRHSAFSDANGLIHFIKRLRRLGEGRPVGFKLCIGRPSEFTAIIHAMIANDTFPDFITVDGGEGGTGAAPPEFSNSVGMPLIEGLTFVNNALIGAGIRGHMKIICAGKVTSGFSIIRNLALGADLCNAARAMMFSLGCIQALKCGSNKCPTGVATQDKDLMSGLDVSTKSVRVRNYQSKTVEYAMDLVCSMGRKAPSEVSPSDVMRRVSSSQVKSLADLYPRPKPNSFNDGTAPKELMQFWLEGKAIYEGTHADRGEYILTYTPPSPHIEKKL